MVEPSAERASQPVAPIEPATTAAAKSALGDLAAGLAKVNASATTADAASRSEALPPLTRTVFAEPEFFVAGPAKTAATPATASPAPSTDADTSAPPRTMEDTVAELLRPLLKQWLADNMPRIVEKALRIELAASLKPPAKDT